ncbi:MAG: hypothetical protein M3O64_02395, partial [Chloroflexota bacterium]|nr:hypothetical protein [Chloroflexota bacterium]
LDPRDQATLRASRLEVGRAIRDARARRRNPVPAVVFTPGARPRRFPFALATTVVLVAAMLFALSLIPVNELDGGGGGAPAAVPSAPVKSTAPQSRGRVKIAVPVIVPVVESPVPTTVPVVVIQPTADPDAFPTDALSVVPGPGIGAGTGTGLATCGASVPPGFARLCGQVIDASTSKGLADACMSLGPCSSQAIRTDANGRWSLTLPLGDGNLTWFLEFSKTGYATSKFTQSSRLGRTLIPTQRLVPVP